VQSLALPLLVFGLIALVASGAQATSPFGFGFFKTPSAKIFCQWAAGGSPSARFLMSLRSWLTF
jgi:hypothetical protein